MNFVIRLMLAISILTSAIVSPRTSATDPSTIQVRFDPGGTPECVSWEDGRALDTARGWVGMAQTGDGGRSWRWGTIDATAMRVLGLESGDDKPSTLEVSTYFLDLRRGWLRSLSKDATQQVWHTRDGGMTWSATEFRGWIAISFADDKRGWLAQSVEGGALDSYVTENGGRAWEKCTTSTAGIEFVDDVYLLDRQNGWGLFYGKSCPQCESGLWVARTSDQGCSWQWLWRAARAFKLAGRLFFLDEREGWLASDLEGLLHTTDGGSGWQAVTLPDGVERVRSVFFSDSQHGWIAELRERVWATTNGGTEWSLVPRDRFLEEEIPRAQNGRIWEQGLLLQMLLRGRCQ